MVQMKKRTKSATNNRRSHHALKPKTLIACPKCKKAIMPHRACAACGFFKNTETVKVKLPKAKK
jgi:large subunit ribosomal protein L32